MMPAKLVHRMNVYWQKNHHEYHNEHTFGRAHVINKQYCDIFYCVISWYPLHSAKKTSKHFIKDPCWMEILIRAFQGSYIYTAILRSQNWNLCIVQHILQSIALNNLYVGVSSHGRQCAYTFECMFMLPQNFEAYMCIFCLFPTR